ncbi:hypothetical protein ACSW9V_15195 (plasmid) [Clostridium perfringens]|uniref:hypothetical protein n=1 Tax=Clostridium perfringens TaxID=1502 RepID=UPI000B39572E|nr:hypothetical protein [Clostridium perfringens]EGT0690043.1 hypothetical protein [Clostridium perfringens]EGT0693567.1 hypothetical protein [Clostridium perfringens]EGT0696832.1 hypothetical protein [Clostridium perfringens]MDU3376228.1 hypothetical protein [Clostridium perfringens]MDU3534184.1 hypothetical protein [Clostridium perfringens]
MKKLKKLLNQFNEESNLKRKNIICKQILKEGLISKEDLNKILIGFCRHKVNPKNKEVGIEFYFFKYNRLHTKVLDIYTLDDKITSYQYIKTTANNISKFIDNLQLGGTTYISAKILKVIIQYNSYKEDFLYLLINFRNLLNIDDHSFNSILKHFKIYGEDKTYSLYIYDNELKVKDYDKDIIDDFSPKYSIKLPATIELISAIQGEIVIIDENNI